MSGEPNAVKVWSTIDGRPLNVFSCDAADHGHINNSTTNDVAGVSTRGIGITALAVKGSVLVAGDNSGRVGVLDFTQSGRMVEDGNLLDDACESEVSSSDEDEHVGDSNTTAEIATKSRFWGTRPRPMGHDRRRRNSIIRIAPS